MKNAYRILLILQVLILFASSSCYAQLVKVRIISAKDSKPLSGQMITLSLLYDNSQKIPLGLETTIQVKTDSKGEASFNLTQPAPVHLGAQVHLTSNNWRCACSMLAATDDVINKGVTVTATTQKSTGATPGNVHPGEILFSARPLTFFERLIEPLVKQ